MFIPFDELRELARAMLKRMIVKRETQHQVRHDKLGLDCHVTLAMTCKTSKRGHLCTHLRAAAVMHEVQ